MDDVEKRGVLTAAGLIVYTSSAQFFCPRAFRDNMLHPSQEEKMASDDRKRTLCMALRYVSGGGGRMTR